MTAETLEDAGFSFDDITPESAASDPGPLTGSRGTRSTGTGARRGRPRKSSKLQDLQKRLSGEMFQAGAMIGMGLNTTGYYICQESDSFTKALVELAAKRPEWIEALEHIADVQPGIVVGRTMVGMGAAFAVDRGRADPEKQFMKFLGVYSAWKSVQQKAGEVGEGSGYKPPPAGAFTPLS